MRRQEGISLIELLVAISILLVVLGITSTSLISGLRVQRDQEIITTSQAKLRRVNEVFTQELRSAVLGGVANQPFPSTATSISFMLLDGGAGWQVLPHDSGNNNSFKNAANAQVVAAVASADELDLDGGQVLMVNANGDAVILDINNVQRRGGAGSVEWNVVHPGCGNTIDFTPNTLMFKVRTIGFQYDPSTQTLFHHVGSANSVPLAFDISDFRIDYVYQENDGTPVSLNAPLLNSDGAPVKNGRLPGGTAVSLTRLQVLLGASNPAGNRTIERKYSGQVEFSSNPSFSIQAVSSCN